MGLFLPCAPSFTLLKSPSCSRMTEWIVSAHKNQSCCKDYSMNVEKWCVYLYPDGDMYDFPQSLVGQPSDRRIKRIQRGMIILLVLLIISLILSISAIAAAANANRKIRNTADESLEAGPHHATLIKKIAFGSCTSHFVDPQPIWSKVGLCRQFHCILL